MYVPLLPLPLTRRSPSSTPPLSPSHDVQDDVHGPYAHPTNILLLTRLGIPTRRDNIPHSIHPLTLIPHPILQPLADSFFGSSSMPKAATSKAPKEKAEKAEKKVSRFTSPYIPNTPYSPFPLCSLSTATRRQEGEGGPEATPLRVHVLLQGLEREGQGREPRGLVRCVSSSPTVLVVVLTSSTGELGKLLGAKWKELEEADKAVSQTSPSSNLRLTVLLRTTSRRPPRISSATTTRRRPVEDLYVPPLLHTLPSS